MRVVFVLALVVATTLPLGASFNCPLYFDTPHVTLLAASPRHGVLEPLSVLPAKGLAMLLEEYVVAKIERGELPPSVRFEIFDVDRTPGVPEVQVACLTRSRGTYTIYTWDLSLRNLVRLVEFSASPRWRSYCPDEDDPRKTPGLEGRRQQNLERLLDELVGEPDLRFFRGRRAVVYQVGELAVVYQDGRLFYELAGAELGFSPRGFLPVQVGDRYLFQYGRGVVVVESGRVIARHPLPDRNEEAVCDGTVDQWVEACSKWVNFGCHRTAVLSYSAERNQFFPIHIENYSARCSCALATPFGGRWGECA